MSFKHLRAFIAIMAGCVLASCHSEIDLKNIDKTAELEMGLALPIGSVHAKISDFFGQGAGDFYVDTISEKDGGHKGVITWKHTFDIDRPFHDDSLDLTNMVSNKTLYLNVYDSLPNYYVPGTTDKIVAASGIQKAFRFEMPIKLNGINQKLGGDRLDSALIEMARFTSTIDTCNGLPFTWEWIDEVTLELGNQINRPGPGRNVMTVYKKGDPGDYTKPIKTDIDAFTICLMKNRDLDPKTQWSLYDLNNVIDSCVFWINFKFTIPEGTPPVTVPKDAGFNYNMNVEFIKYKAIWGKFVPSSDMHDEDEIPLRKYLGDMDFISKWSIPFTDPRIDMHVITHIAGAMVLNGDYLYTIDANNDTTYAEFYSNRQHNFRPNIVPGQYLPLSSQIGDSTENLVIPFSKAESEGRIDRLFQNMPQKLAYKFNVNFNYQETPQIRITPNTNVRVSADCTLPFIFNEGLYLNYIDTIQGVNLTQYSIESMIDSVKMIDTVKATDVVLFLKAHNSIPLDVYASMRCLDSLGNIIPDPIDSTKPLLLFPQDTITLKAPNYVNNVDTWNSTPGETVITARLTKKQLDLLPKIKSIHYEARINDKSLKEAYNNGLSNVRITENQGITLKIGVTAHIDAIFDLNVEDNKK